MKTLFVSLSLLLMTGLTFGQKTYDDFKPGDVLSINKTSNNAFSHIHFPKENFIRKRGAIPNYKSLDGVKVKIEAINEDSTVKLVTLNGKRFFNALMLRLNAGPKTIS